MKILIISSSVEEGLGKSFLRAFESLKIETGIVDDEKLYRETNPLSSNRYCRRLFRWFLAIPLQKEMLKAVIKEKPNLILVLKGSLIKPKTISGIKKSLPRTLIFNFNPDNPFNTWHHGISNSWIKKSIPLYDAYFIWGKFLLGPLKKAGAKNVEYLPFGYDFKLHHPIQASEKDKKYYGSDVAFIGTWDEERQWWANHLLDYDLKIWGNGWEKSEKELQKKWQGKAIVCEEFSKICDASKIIVNIVRKQNIPAHNLRTFEIPACRGFALSTRTLEQQEFFKEAEEADYFSTPEELRQKIDFYLKNGELRRKIAQAGHQRLVNSDYSCQNRAKKVLDVYYARIKTF